MSTGRRRLRVYGGTVCFDLDVYAGGVHFVIVSSHSTVETPSPLYGVDAWIFLRNSEASSTRVDVSGLIACCAVLVR